MPLPESSTNAPADLEELYQTRRRRYVTAMRNGKPDCVPIRPFVAEFTGRHAGYDCQQLAHDYELAFAAACGVLQIMTGMQWCPTWSMSGPA